MRANRYADDTGARAQIVSAISFIQNTIANSVPARRFRQLRFRVLGIRARGTATNGLMYRIPLNSAANQRCLGSVDWGPWHRALRGGGIVAQIAREAVPRTKDSNGLLLLHCAPVLPTADPFIMEPGRLQIASL